MTKVLNLIKRTADRPKQILHQLCDRDAARHRLERDVQVPRRRPGRHTKRGSGFLVGGVLGGACLPPLTGAAAGRHGSALTMVVPLYFFVGAWTYRLVVNFWPWYRDTADAFATTDVGLRGRRDDAAADKKAVEASRNSSQT